MPSPILFEIHNKKIYLLFDYNIDKETCIIDKSYSADNSIIYLLTSWYKSGGAIKIANCNKNYNIVILANSEEEKLHFENELKEFNSEKFNSLEFNSSEFNSSVLYCNHNAFLDENIFKIKNNIDREYDLVIDSCFCNYKNRDIACKLDNTVHIGYFKRDEKMMPSFGTIANYINDNYTRLNKDNICHIYNKSYVAGIFSKCEGACFASTQYLLAGIPVVSIESKGGRDIWYNTGNSIICDNNKDDCYKSVMKAKEMLINGEFNRESIRNNTIELMNKFRNKFKEHLIIKFKNIFNIEINIDELNINFSIY